MSESDDEIGTLSALDVLGPERLDKFKQLPLQRVPGFIEQLNEELDAKFVAILSADEDNFQLIEVTSDQLNEDGKLPIPVVGYETSGKND